jgi:hypothetical protein
MPDSLLLVAAPSLTAGSWPKSWWHVA